MARTIAELKSFTDSEIKKFSLYSNRTPENQHHININLNIFTVHDNDTLKVAEASKPKLP